MDQVRSDETRTNGTTKRRWKSRALWAAATTAAGMGLGSTPADAAGAITVTLTGGVLTITGDDSANSVQINPSGGSYIVNGISTTVTGGNFFDAASVNSIVVRLNGGDDSLVVTGITVSGGVTIDMGADADQCSVSGMSITGALSIDGGTGNDSIQVSQADLRANVTLDPGEGAFNENVLMFSASVGGSLTLRDSRDGAPGDLKGGFSVTGCVVAGALVVEAGPSGTDYNGALNSITGALRYVGSGGPDRIYSVGDTIGNVNAEMGDGDDQVTFIALDTSGAVTVLLGTGNDTFDASGGERAGKGPRLGTLLVRGSIGDDTIRLGADQNQIETGRFDLHGGTGNDQVFVLGVSAPQGRVRCGDGTDVAFVNEANVPGKLRFEGGIDNDELVGFSGSGNQIGKKSQKEFESFSSYSPQN